MSAIRERAQARTSTTRCGSTAYLSIPAAISSKKTLHLLKKLIHHHLGNAPDHSLPDPGDQTSYLRIGAVFENRLSVFFLQVHRHVPLHETWGPGTLAAEHIVCGGLLVPDRDFAFVSSFHRGDADFHRRLKLLRRHFGKTLAPRHALGHDLRIQQEPPQPPPTDAQSRNKIFFLSTFF